MTLFELGALTGAFLGIALALYDVFFMPSNRVFLLSVSMFGSSVLFLVCILLGFE